VKIFAPLFVVLLTATALADEAPPPPIPGTPPAGWKQRPEHARVVHDGILAGLSADIAAANVRVYSFSPKDGGAQVIFSVLDVAMPDDAAAAAFVRQRVDELKNTAQMMVDDGGGRVRQIQWQEHPDETNRVVDALLEWAHDDNATQSLVRAAWVKLPAKPYVIEEVRAECVLAADAVATMRPVCSDALASMMLPELAARLPISADAAVVTPTKPTEAPSMTATPAGTPVPARPVVEKTPPRDWRAFYVIGALIALGAALMWNRRRREAYDEEAAEKQDETDADEPDEEQS
jgi:hypothetical protein